MSDFENLDIEKLMLLYEKKRQLIKSDNLMELIHLKNKFPELFIKENEIQLNNLIDDCNHIALMPHFQQMLKEERKNRLITVDFNQWKLEMFDELQNNSEIRIKDILFISRKIVQKILVLTQSIYNKKNSNIELSTIFPYLGVLITNIIKLFPHERYEKVIETVRIKLKCEKNENISCEFKEWKELVLFDEMQSEINNVYTDVIGNVIKKFDQRPAFYNDLLFFWLIYTLEYIALLAPHINNKGINIILDLVIKM